MPSRPRPGPGRSRRSAPPRDSRINALLEHAPGGVAILDAGGAVQYVSAAGLPIVGRAEDEIVGHHFSSLVLADDLPEATALFEQLLAAPMTGVHSRLRFAHRLHGSRDVELVAHNRIADPEIGGIIVNFLDVTERALADQALSRSEERLRGLFDSNVVNITIGDDQGNILDANEAFLSMLGYPREDLEAGRLKWTELTPPESLEVNWRAHEEVRTLGRCTPFEKQYIRRDGSRVWVLISLARLPSQPGHTVSISTDITARKELEEQVRQAQKMEAIGRLAGGIAHDFNNLLTVIIGFSEVLLIDRGLSEEARADAREVLKAAQSAAGLTKQLLTFSRRQTLAPRMIDINAVVTNMRAMMARLMGEDVAIVTDLAPALPQVYADPTQMEQVVVNLAVNANDAMPEGGTLRLATRAVALDDGFVEAHRGARAGPHVLLEVGDTGSGMSDEVKSRLFEPFFTTKEQGKGTGLGLATIYGIVKQSRGYVRVDSAPGAGTTFEIYLPVIAVTGEEG